MYSINHHLFRSPGTSPHNPSSPAPYYSTHSHTKTVLVENVHTPLHTLQSIAAIVDNDVVSCHEQVNAIAYQSCFLPFDVEPPCSTCPSPDCRVDFEMLSLADGSLFAHGQAEPLENTLNSSLAIEF
jgi:hypothetical protein